MMITKPPRGFELSEFETRMAGIQKRMGEQNLDSILLTTEPEVLYFTGFQTQFWQSPTRPWFVILPLEGKPVAVIPGIGEAGMRSTWVEDVYTWPAPRPEDDGITLLAQTLKDLPRRYGRIGVPLGHESLLRMPAGDYAVLRDKISAFEIVDVSMMIHQIRFVKSAAEIAKINYVCDLTSAAFEELPNTISIGQTEREICHQFRIDLLRKGADTSPYIISGSGPGGYDSIIMGPLDRVLVDGDVLIIDTGTTYDGYYCDFDRNFAFGHMADDTRRAYETVYKSTDAGFAAARPGATTSDVYHAMWDVLEAGGALGNNVGRLGHGLGLQLTEWPSNTPSDMTPLEVGVVLTLEPGMEFAPGRQMVHEENIVITEDGARWLSRRAPEEMPVIL